MNAKRTLLVAIVVTALVSLFGVSSPAHAGVRVGIGFNVGIAPPPLRYEYVAPYPGPGFVWVGGFWDWRPYYHRYIWVPGYWARPPYPRAHWVTPRYYRHYYHRGYWR